MSPTGFAILGSGIFAKEGVYTWVRPGFRHAALLWFAYVVISLVDIILFTAHLPAVAALESGVAELKAVYSRSEKSAADLAGFAKELLQLPAVPSVYHDADPHANLDALLARTDIAAVVIALPITLQPTIVRKALAAGKHVLSEKPVAPDVAGGITLINDYNTKYKSKGLIWRVAENYEVEPAYQAAAKVIKDGKIGKVAFFNARVVNYIEKSNKYYNTPWRTIPDVSPTMFAKDLQD